MLLSAAVLCADDVLMGSVRAPWLVLIASRFVLEGDGELVSGELK
jgi:hypothetical protein